MREAIFYKAFKLLYNDVYNFLSTSEELGDKLDEKGLLGLADMRDQFSNFNEGRRVQSLSKYISNLDQRPALEIVNNFKILIELSLKAHTIGSSFLENFIYDFFETRWKINEGPLSSANIRFAQQV